MTIDALICTILARLGSLRNVVIAVVKIHSTIVRLTHAGYPSASTGALHTDTARQHVTQSFGANGSSQIACQTFAAVFLTVSHVIC